MLAFAVKSYNHLGDQDHDVGITLIVKSKLIMNPLFYISDVELCFFSYFWEIMFYLFNSPMGNRSCRWFGFYITQKPR